MDKCTPCDMCAASPLIATAQTLPVRDQIRCVCVALALDAATHNCVYYEGCRHASVAHTPLTLLLAPGYLAHSGSSAVGRNLSWRQGPGAGWQHPHARTVMASVNHRLPEPTCQAPIASLVVALSLRLLRPESCGSGTSLSAGMAYAFCFQAACLSAKDVQAHGSWQLPAVSDAGVTGVTTLQVMPVVCNVRIQNAFPYGSACMCGCRATYAPPHYGTVPSESVFLGTKVTTLHCRMHHCFFPGIRDRPRVLTVTTPPCSSSTVTGYPLGQLGPGQARYT
jgi:hypothetical protein